MAAVKGFEPLQTESEPHNASVEMPISSTFQGSRISQMSL